MVNRKLLKKLDTVVQDKKRTIIMGVINLSLDSFSKDGTQDKTQIYTQVKSFIENGADIIDLGAQSSRPLNTAKMESSIFGEKWGVESSEISAEKEMEILLPIVDFLVEEFDVLLSIDTYRSNVAYESLVHGASIINDIWGLKYDAEIAKVISQYEGKLVIMHNQENNIYNSMLTDVAKSLLDSINVAKINGLKQNDIILDPGFGFGKNVQQNLTLLNHLDYFSQLGYPLMIGTSRKSAIGSVLNSPVDDRLEGTAATIAVAIAKGVDIVRIHDVVSIAKTVKMTDAIIRGID